jgi:KAP family P-loop domain
MPPPNSFPDIPGRLDLLRFERYAGPLVDLLAAPQTRTPLTVGIFGPWGSGKSTLLGLVEQEMEKKEHEGAFVRVKFNPWIHRGENNMLVPLLHSLQDALKTWQNEFAASANKIFDVLARLGADIFLKAITFNAVDLDRLDKLEKQYLESHKQVQSEMRNLRKTLQDLATEVGRERKGKRGPRLVFLIDDLDRCQPDEIIDVLEAVKLFLDVENVIVILAVDKEVIDHGIEVRYHKFEFGKERAPQVGAEYLEKMVQLPLTLLPLDVGQVGQYLDRLGLPPTLAPHKGLLASLLLPNPRKIKRVLNLLAFGEAVMGRAGLDPKPLLGQVIRLVVLQAQDGALYDRIARQPELLVALQTYYEALRKGEKPDLSRFGERARDLEQVCKANHRPGSYLARVFRDDPFTLDGVEGKLPQYLTLLEV